MVEQLTAFAWRDLTVELANKRERRQLVAGAAGTAYRGRVLAILGPSGAGKSTLLQALAGRLEKTSKLQLSGSIEPPQTQPGAFIYQDDAFHSRLTVEETLRFAAALRLPASEASARVAEALIDYGLADVASSVVGGNKTRGISGGERKRLAIGASLLAADSFAPIFADEPTSGLDSYQARRVTTTLRESADMRGGGRVVVLSIHQPSWTILENIDDVVLLGAGGSTLYYGTKLKMLETLGAMARCPRPLELSPAEWALEIASVDPHNADESKRRVAAVAATWRASGIASLDATTILHTSVRLDLLRESQAPLPASQGSLTRSSWLLQLRWCLWRSWRQATASWALLAMRIFGNVMTGAVFGFIWLQLPNDPGSIKARVGLLQVLANFVGVTAAMKAVRTLQDGEFVAVRRERASGSLRLSPYFLGKVLAELPVSLALPCLLVAIVHPMARLALPLAHLTLYLGLEAFAASMLGTAVGAAAPTLDVGLEATKALSTLSTVFGGLYFDASTLPWLLRWLPRASIVRVTWGGLLTCEAFALARVGIVPSAQGLLTEHGIVGAGDAAGPTAPPPGRAWWLGAAQGCRGVEPLATSLVRRGGEVEQLLCIGGMLAVAAYIALAAKAPRFHALGSGNVGDGPSRAKGD